MMMIIHNWIKIYLKNENKNNLKKRKINLVISLFFMRLNICTLRTWRIWEMSPAALLWSSGHPMRWQSESSRCVLEFQDFGSAENYHGYLLQTCTVGRTGSNSLVTFWQFNYHYNDNLSTHNNNKSF